MTLLFNWDEKNVVNQKTVIEDDLKFEKLAIILFFWQKSRQTFSKEIFKDQFHDISPFNFFSLLT